MAMEKNRKLEPEKQLAKQLDDTFPASDPPSITQPGSGITGAEVARDDSRSDKIRERAYAIWLDEGQSHGRDEEHWRQAAGEIDREAEKLSK